jgi:hypothetical protein
MDSMEVLAARLVGTWRSVLVSDERESGCFRFLEDLRYIGIQPLVPPMGRQHFVEWRMWCEFESESTLRMTYHKNRRGEVRELHFEGETLVLKAKFSQQDGDTEPRKHVWRCHRLRDEEIPEWFEPEFIKAMARPWL